MTHEVGLPPAAGLAEHSPLLLEGWLEFNRIKWNLTPHRFRWQPDSSALPYVEAVFYLDRKGRIVHPRVTPYQAVQVVHTPTDHRHRLCAQWLQAADPLVAEMRRLGLRDRLKLPPGLEDVRPFQWARYRVGVQYTYVIDLPCELSQADGRVRTRINKAGRSGYVCTRTRNMHDVMACLADTEERQGFAHRLSVRDLELAQELLGEEQLHASVCYAPDGSAAAAQLVLHRRGAQALGWVAGCRREHRSVGVNQLLLEFTLEDLQAAGAHSLDLVGANIRSVAEPKMRWGGRLVPYYTLEEPGMRTMLRELDSWWRFRRERQGGGE
jgi:hypothetical protein